MAKAENRNSKRSEAPARKKQDQQQQQQHIVSKARFNQRKERGCILLYQQAKVAHTREFGAKRGLGVLGEHLVHGIEDLWLDLTLGAEHGG